VLQTGFNNSIEFAKKLDAEDQLRRFRSHFLIPCVKGREQIYFLGNSLGLQPRHTKEEINVILDQWASYGVEGFFLGPGRWLDFHEGLTRPLAEIVGAAPHEITVMNQLTVNLHLMLVSFYRPVGKRRKILCEAKAFPSDQYMLQTHVRHHGLDPDEVIIEVQPPKGEHVIREEDILQAIREHHDELALALFSGVNYYTGQVFDMRAVTDAAHEFGIPAGFDLAHAVGNISLELHNWNVDFACWCSYKYLNSGPGAVGAAFIHERYHRDKNIERFGGWWGHDKDARFRMEKEFMPIGTAEGWQLSTPSILLYAAHKAALDMFEEAGWDNLLTKQKLLTDYFWFTLDDINASTSRQVINLITPREERRRGCQVSMFMLNSGKEIFHELTRRGVMVDWREPNVVRAAPVPLYNSFEDVWTFGQIVKGIIQAT